MHITSAPLAKSQPGFRLAAAPPALFGTELSVAVLMLYLNNQPQTNATGTQPPMISVRGKWGARPSRSHPVGVPPTGLRARTNNNSEYPLFVPDAFGGTPKV